jgi:hypothetical protein
MSVALHTQKKRFDRASIAPRTEPKSAIRLPFGVAQQH